MVSLRIAALFASALVLAGCATFPSGSRALLEVEVQSPGEHSRLSLRGTIAEVSNGNDVAFVLGAPASYQTHRGRSGVLYAFVAGGETRLESLGRPGSDYGFFLDVIDGELNASPRRRSSERYAWREASGWIALENSPRPDCGRIRSAYAGVELRDSCIIDGARTIRRSDLPDLNSEGRVYAPYYDGSNVVWDGVFPEGRGFFVCAANDPSSCVQHFYEQPNDFFYAIWPREHSIMMSTTSGQNIEFITENRTINIVDSNPDRSYQLYSAFSHYDGTVLGHYPSGQLYFDAGVDSPSLMSSLIPLDELPTRGPFEAQSVHYYNGSLWVGV